MKTVEEILYKVWKEQLSVTNGSAEIVSIIEAERAKNAALVAALEEIKKPWYVFKLGKRASLKNTLEQYKTRCMVIHDIASRAIRANTEKGGSDAA